MIREESRKRRKATKLKGSAMNLHGNQQVQSVLTTCSNGPIHVKELFDNLLEKVVERRNLNLALERVEKNEGAPGVDKMTTKELRLYLIKHGAQIKQQLLDGTYRPSPVRRVEIPKSGGGTRSLGIPTVLDRFVQQAIAQVLIPFYEPIFSPFSYGFRPGRSTKQALEKAQEYVKSGRKYVVDMDLEKHFDRINHDILMSILHQRIKDKRVLRLIRLYLQSGVMINGCVMDTQEGAPQGGPLSPLLSNIMLDVVDKELEKRGHYFVRYADDCNIYVASKRAGERVFVSITKFLESRLRQKVNSAKSAVAYHAKRTFLGFVIGNGKGKSLWLSPRSKTKLKERIKQLTKRSWGISMEDRIKKLNEYLIGWFGYFKTAESAGFLEEIDQWMRRRMRMCLIKQWKKCSTWLRNLVKLGIAKDWAGCVAFSRKGEWRLSNTPQINKALGTIYWREQGLESLLEKYYQSRMMS